jgi:YHS domain-containing protein
MFTRFFVLLALSLTFTACTSAPERLPNSSPNATVEGAIEAAEIAGYCPVAYVLANKPVKGVKEYPATHNGLTYWFVDAGAQKAFVDNPKGFEVMYRGWDALAMIGGQKLKSDPTIFAVKQGQVYLFVNSASRDTFMQSLPEMKEGADKAWSKMGGQTF